MQLADEIVILLSSSKEGTLSEAMLKTKVLLSQIGKKEPIEWINKELNGYDDSDELPEYRVLETQIMGNIVTITGRWSAHPLPVHHLEKNFREKWLEARMTQPLAVLEKLIEKDGGQLVRPIPLEANGLFDEGLTEGAHVERAWCNIQPSNVSNIIFQVRSRLLDFVLALNEELPDELTKDTKEKTRAIDADSMFRNAIHGNNNTIVIGSHNQNIANNTQGDFNGLAETLRKHNLPEEDILALKNAVENDVGGRDEESKEFGPAVKNWIGNVMQKAANAAWQIELSLAANLIMSSLQRYYG